MKYSIIRRDRHDQKIVANFDNEDEALKKCEELRKSLTVKERFAENAQYYCRREAAETEQGAPETKQEQINDPFEIYKFIVTALVCSLALPFIGNDVNIGAKPKVKVKPKKICKNN